MSNFYEIQEDAKDQTVWLIVLLIAASVTTVVAFATIASFATVVCSMAYMSLTTNMNLRSEFFAQAFFDRWWICTLGSSCVVLGTAIYKTVQLSEESGRTIAQQLGGTRIIEMSADQSQKRILNIVEELAIAAGVLAPKVYVLENEDSINAFAAGTREKEYILCFTRGAIDRLTRDQLQGIVAHELSHIVNHDTRLNVRVMGALAGLHALSSMAEWLLRLGFRSDGGIGLGKILAAILGGVVFPVGKIGESLAALIKLGLNRQREFLADGKAVELTRNPGGLEEAMQVIAQQGSRILSPQAALASHLFFAESRPSPYRILHTHPPLWSRIRRLCDREESVPEVGTSAQS